MFSKYKKIHFIGIGGIGISALAKWAVLENVKVSGSDIFRSQITNDLENMGAKIFIGHKKENISNDVDLIIYSFAVPKDNVERKNKIKQLSYFEALGEATKGKDVIAVSGTNGKSTTTAMLGKVLLDAGMDPTIIIGSKVDAFRYGNFHLGKSNLFLLEACEHNAHMLLLHPNKIVLTNIEEDHLDFYKNLKNILKTFKEYINKVDNNFLVYNLDDKNTCDIVSSGISYGVSDNADYRFTNRHIENEKQIFTVFNGDKMLGEVVLKIPGLFNVYNAMAGIIMAMTLGIEFEIIKKSLLGFNGLWRRFEYVGKFNGADIISDYGHHPSAIKGTLLATREFFTSKRIVLAFEPHQHHRTKALFADFVRSFDNADVLILSEIYNVEGRMEDVDKDISSKKLSEAVLKYWESSELKIDDKKIFYSKDLEETKEILKDIIKKGDIVLIMGAGNIDRVAREICNNL